MPGVLVRVRSGTSLSFRVNWWPPGPKESRTARIDSSDFTARLEIGTLKPKRTFVQAREWRGTGTPPAGTVLLYIQPGEYEVRLGKTVTQSLPIKTRIELELTNNADPEDVVQLLDGDLVVSPEGVTHIDYAL